MPARRLPGPVAAGIGLVARGADAVRQVPEELPTVPVRALTFTLRTLAAARSTYDELAARGEEAVGHLRRRDRKRVVDVTDEVVDRLRAEDEQPQPPGSTVAGLVPEFDLAEDVAEQVADATPGETLAHDELPLADYDHLTLGSLRARLPRLSPVALVQLRDYERAHGNRLPVITMLENRLAKVAAAGSDGAGR